MIRLFLPHHRIGSVVELTPERLDELELSSLLLDVDCTLKHYRSSQLAPEILDWLSRTKERGIGLCLVSNGRGRRIRVFAESVGIPCIAPAFKPFPQGCRKAVRMLNFDPQRTAMVGDQIFADILAGRLAGLKTILVTPMRPDLEPWFARMKRPLERFVLGDRFKQQTSSINPSESSCDQPGS